MNPGGSIAALHMVGCAHGEGSVIVSSCIKGLSLFQGTIFGSRIQKRTPVYLRVCSLPEGSKGMDEHRETEGVPPPYQCQNRILRAKIGARLPG